ncbi:hypothetical protein DSC45_29830 [Streptomyces sp. YIM 130001]|nr:hypothetical protein DSC45_29830 [Streptomyces sp. YIM 130001]
MADALTHAPSRDGRPREDPALPSSRGPLSHAVHHALRTSSELRDAAEETVAVADPWGEDLQLALYLLYELHYRGFAGVDDELEWNPGLLRLRRSLENRYLAALRESVPGTPTADALDGLVAAPDRREPPGLGHHLAHAGTLDQLREYAALRSLYHLKEADPHAWVIPRLTGTAKAAMVAVEFDEFGAGRADGIHARLFADLMDDLDLDSRYGYYVDRASAAMLASVNLMSLFGLHRSLRGALVGHFAHVETTSSPASRRLAAALRRVGAGAAAVRFYTEHVEADAVHEQVVRHQVVEGLLADEPWLEDDVGFGIEATSLVEERFGAEILGHWRAGRSALCDRPAPIGAADEGYPGRVRRPHRRARASVTEGKEPADMPAGSNAKRERQYEHIREGAQEHGASKSRAKEIAARTVNKERARSGESRTASRTSTKDPKSAPERGGQRSHSGAEGPTKDQLYAEARKKNIEGRSGMNKKELRRALGY